MPHISILDTPKKDKYLVKNHGIATHLGHWIPAAALQETDENEVGDKDEELFRLFKSHLKRELNLNIENIKDSILNDLESLKKSGFVDPDTKAPGKLTRAHLDGLLSNSTKLERIFYNRSWFDLPYLFTQDIEIENLYEELGDSIQKCRKKNLAMTNYLKANVEADLSCLVDSQKYFG